MFTTSQKEYLEGFFAGMRSGGRLPYVGHSANGLITADPASGGPNLAAEPEAEPSIFGTPLSELSKEERWKYELNPLDAWESLLASARDDTPPEGGDVFRFKFHGLFYVAPAQDAFMVRVRVPGNVLRADQLRGLAGIAEEWGGGYGDVTTRGNVQLREFAPRRIVDVLMRLADLGLNSRGSGADNVRNITASPTSGFDPQELIDVVPLARALQFYLLNHRDLYGLPRKFNVAFDSGGSIGVVSDTNDIGFLATLTRDGKIVFRVLLAGITGHGQFGLDAGIGLAPSECVAAAAAMIRVFNEDGDRTDRKKARLKYLIDRWGVARFIEAVQSRVAFPLLPLGEDACEPRPPTQKHGHLGVHPERDPRLRYLGVAIPVGRMTAAQMRGLADVAESFGAGELRTTVWQNAIIPHVPVESVESAVDALHAIGFDVSASEITGGIVACTGNTGCKFSATDTKGHGSALARELETRSDIDRPLRIHLTGCPNSCAQHFIGDIGLLGIKTTIEQESIEAYHLYLGGGSDEERGLGRRILSNVPAERLAPTISAILDTYALKRRGNETFGEFVRRHETPALEVMFGTG
jgi:ferredoxin-nitrite reductase